MMPESPQAVFARARAALASDRKDEALACALQAGADPKAPAGVLAEAAQIAAAAGDGAAATGLLERAVVLQPSRTLRFELARLRMETGDLATAEAEMRAALQRSPREFQFLNLLGVILKRAGRLEESIELFNSAAKASPKAASPWVNMGNCQLALGAPAKAADSYRRATQLDPQTAENHRLLGRALIEARQFDKALAALRTAIARGARDARVHIDMVTIYYQQQLFERALEVVDGALRALPGDLDLQRVRASILRRVGRIEEAKALLEQVIAARPRDIEALVMLGNLYLWGLNQRAEANAVYERALAIDPGHIDAARNYCESLSNSRHGNEAEHFENAYRVACDLLERVRNPLRIAGEVQGVFLRAVDFARTARLGPARQLCAHWAAEMQVTHLHNQLGRVETMDDRLALLAAHKQWGDAIQALAAKNPLPPRAPPVHRAPRKVRIALMSSDLRHHPVTYFVQPILEAYDRSRFELHCYSFYPSEADAVQQHFAARVDGFHVIRGGTDRDIAARIAADEPDILFELGGTTLHNRVQVCAWRPAPVQVSWLGYPHSAGLTGIDHILVDPWNRPTDDRLLLEKPFLMPETWVTLGSLGFRETPIEEGIPEERQGCITFGTANNPYKYTPRCFAAWARVLAAVEGSRFLFVRPEGGAPSFRRNVQAIFASHGIAAERILFEPVRGAHLPHYNRIDIALDPFPHVGGTTTCECLWMGVPVVTLAGPAFFERLSASNLHNAGLGDLCAETDDDYVRIATALAADRERRRFLRHGLRAQIAAHPLGQGERFVRHFEDVTLATLGIAR